MPLLPPEPFVHPENLFHQPGESENQWWVLHTKPRAEKALTRKLLTSKCPFFLPLQKKMIRHGNRVRYSYNPLFTGYLFVCGGVEVRPQVSETNYVVNVLVVSEQQQLQTKLATLHRMMTQGLPMTPESRLQPGSKVIIESGPLSGVTGTLLRRGGQLRFVVEVEILRQGVSVEVEGWMIRPISS